MNKYVCRTAKIKVSEKQMSDFLYWYMICKCKGLKTFNIGLNNYTRKQNSGNYFDVMFEIDEETIPVFESSVEVKLKEPIEIKTT